jgi:hypothetical protein
LAQFILGNPAARRRAGGIDVDKGTENLWQHVIKVCTLNLWH